MEGQDKENRKSIHSTRYANKMKGVQVDPSQLPAAPLNRARARSSAFTSNPLTKTEEQGKARFSNSDSLNLVDATSLNLPAPELHRTLPEITDGQGQIASRVTGLDSFKTTTYDQANKTDDRGGLSVQEPDLHRNTRENTDQEGQVAYGVAAEVIALTSPRQGSQFVYDLDVINLGRLHPELLRTIIDLTDEENPETRRPQSARSAHDEKRVIEAQSGRFSRERSSAA